MTPLDVIRRLHQHRAWVNQKLLAAAASLDDRQLQQPMAIGQGSVWRSLLHLHAAEYVWLAALEGNEAGVLPGDVPDQLPGNQAGHGGIQSLGELQQRWQALENRWSGYLARLDAASLDELVYRRPARGPRRVTRRLDALLHVCTHAHYTVAQVVNMLRQLGAQELPDPMLISMARQELADAGQA